MTLKVSSTAEVSATPQELLEFVLDVDRYRRVDHKITRVSSVTGPDETGLGSIRIWGKMPGLPPAPERQNFTLEKWRRVTFVGAPRQPGRLIMNFVGTFECEPVTDASTRITHAYELNFRRAFTWLERRMEAPLAEEIDEEVQRIVNLFADT